MQLFRLALADLRRDWALSLCQIFALAAVLTPLLVLAGLRQGVLGQLIDDLRRNPAMREIAPRVTGSNRFTEAWLAGARARPDVAFAAGDARFLAGNVRVSEAGKPGAPSAVATMVPSLDNDPWRPSPASAWSEGVGRVVISALLAQDLGVVPGSRLTLFVPHRLRGAEAGRELEVRLALVLPADEMADRRVILASETLVRDIQNFRDDYAVPALGWPGEALPPGPPSYERFRLYAKNIYDVAGLVTWLKAQGIEPISHIEDIGPVQALDHGLATVLLIIAGFAALGMVVAIAATQWSGVQRKRRELALLALLGYDSRFLVSMALLEALILGMAGILASLLLFLGAALSVDAVFVQVQRLAGSACRLTAGEIALVSAATLFLTLGASAAAAWQIARIEPAGLLREA